MSGKRNWGDERRDGHTPPTTDKAETWRPAGKRKYKCKRNKGDHDFYPDRIELHHFTHNQGYSAWAWWKCKACGKPLFEIYHSKANRFGTSVLSRSWYEKKLLRNHRHRAWKRKTLTEKQKIHTRD